MNRRYEICPQMEVYDRIGIDWQPYVMFSSTPNHQSDVVNTDRFGLRNTIFNEKALKIESVKTYQSCSILVGGSTVFGIGSSSDHFTIPSILSDYAKVPCINLGGRAYNSTQELTLFTRLATYFPKIDNVIIFSGLNNLYLSMFDERIFTSFFFSNIFNESMKNAILTPQRKILKFFLNPIYGSSIDYNKMTVADLRTAIFKIGQKKPLEQQVRKKIDIPRALKAVREDLYIWKLLSESMHFNVSYILQPVPSWAQKNLSHQEIQLFDFLDQQNNALGDQKILSSSEIYTEYKTSLENICQDLKINFFDANRWIGQTNEWLFVDRAHLTDSGNLLIAKSLANLPNYKPSH
jgi:hypothetical protein